MLSVYTFIYRRKDRISIQFKLMPIATTSYTDLLSGLYHYKAVGSSVYIVKSDVVHFD